MAAFTWNDATTQHLRGLWAEGLSATTIAARLGTTKGSVIGKVNRLGLAKRESPIGKTITALVEAEPAIPEQFASAAALVEHTTREGWLLAFTDAARAKFEEVGAPLPAKVRVSIGFPSKGARSKVIGECWSAGSSKDGVCEIFIRPSLQSSLVDIAAVLTHELIHAAVGHEAKHGPKFKKPAVALGLEGKMTATVPGKGWHEWADPILAELGAFPGVELRGEIAGGKKAQKNRHVKLECNDCGFTCRTSKSQIEAHPLLVCPTECGGVLVAETQSEGEE